MKSEWFSDWPLDGVACRFMGPSEKIVLAAAGYRYEAQQNVRAGGIFFYELSFASSVPELKPLMSALSAGVYDCDWLPNSNYLAATFATGEFVLLDCVNGTSAAVASSCKLTDSAVLTNVAIDETGHFFACGDHSGKVYLMSRSNANVSAISSWQAHKEAPTWSAAFDSQRNLILSCGDDSLIHAWDHRDTGRPAFTLKGHDAGVCAISPLSNGDVLVSGSYDETLRSWDLRHCKESQSTVDRLNLECGVWKLRKQKLSNNCYNLLAACLEGGVAVAGIDCSSGRLHLLKNMENEEWAASGDEDYTQLVYGVDFVPEHNLFVACTHSSKNGTGRLQLYSL